MRSQKPVVLLAEDNADIREVTKTLLEMEGCSVIEAADGLAAVEAATASVPDLILLDIHMPLMDGLEVAFRLRQRDSTRHIAILAVTASGQCYRRQTIEAGCNDCLSKPLLPDAIRKALTKYVTRVNVPEKAAQLEQKAIRPRYTVEQEQEFFRNLLVDAYSNH